MPKRKAESSSAPRLRRHRRARGDQGFVQVNGRRKYLGRWGTADTNQAYARFAAEWKANGGRFAPASPDDITVVEVADRYLAHADAYYRGPDGVETSELRNLKCSIATLRELYGRMPARDFGPRALEAVRCVMLSSVNRRGGGKHTNAPEGLTRGVINARIGHLKRMFRWAASKELIPGSVFPRLQSLAGLPAGRSPARESEPVRPVPQSDIDAVRPHVPSQVWAVVQLQLLTGARAGELLIARPIDFDTTGKVWTYAPPTHKTAWRGHDREIYVGPRGQEVLRPFLSGRAVEAFLFDPHEAEAHRHAQAKTHRRADQAASPTKTDRTMGAQYTTASYRRAIHRACDVAGVPRWGVHRLRHNAATNLRQAHGLEAAALMLGHSSPVLTDAVYAERDKQRAFELARAFG